MLQVYLGPSLNLEDAKKISPSANFHPPIQLGDIQNLLQRGDVDEIAIIDGYFERVPAVWHKEILLALENGVRVYGASSMGCLRALELETFGMVGHGEIFNTYYKAGVVEDDDEVAVSHSDQMSGYVNMSIPMINIRYCASQILDEKLLPAQTLRNFVDDMKTVFYPKRDDYFVKNYLENVGVSLKIIDYILEELKGGKFDLKRKDAVSLLKFLTKNKERDNTPPNFKMNYTVFWDRMQVSLKTWRKGSQSILEREIVNYAIVTRHSDRSFKTAYLLRTLSNFYSQSDLNKAEINAGISEVRYNLGLKSNEATHAWITENDVDLRQLQSMGRDEISRLGFLYKHTSRIPPNVLQEIKGTDKYGGLKAIILQRQSKLNELGWTEISFDNLNITKEELFVWAKEKYKFEARSAEQCAFRMGFIVIQNFWETILGLYFDELNPT